MEVYTYGSGEFIATIFEAVKALTSGGTILGLLKVVLIAGFFAALSATVMRAFNSSVSMPLAGDSGDSFSPIVIMIRNCVIGAVAVGFFLNPVMVTDVVIEDRYEPAQSRVVTGVPYGLAFIGYTSSVIGDKIGEALEELLTPVEAVRFRTGGGVGIGPKYLNDLFELMPPGAEAEYGGVSNVPIRGVVEAWFSQCIYSKFALIEGEGPRAEGLTEFTKGNFLLTEPALNQPPFNDPNTPLSVQFFGYPDANETTCANATTQIMTRWYNNVLFEKWITRFSARLLGTKENDATVVPRVYDMVDRYFPDSALGSQDKLVQLAVLNAAYSAFVKMQSEYSQGGASEIAQRRQVGGWMEMARTGARTLIIIRQIAEAIIYFFGAFLPIFIAAAGFGVLTKYIRAIFWLQLWVPIFVLLNAISDFYLLKAIESVSQYTGAIGEIVLNFATVDRLRIETGMVVGYLGLLSLSVPAIAWGILKGTDSLGGMVGSIASTHESGKAGASTSTQRTSDLASFSGGAMVASAHGSGVGQSNNAGGMMAADKYGLGAMQNMTAVNFEHGLSVATPGRGGEINAAARLGSATLAESGGIGLTSNTMKNIGTGDQFDYMKKSGALPANMDFAEFERTKHLKSEINTPDGVQKNYFSPDGNPLYSSITGSANGGKYDITRGPDGGQIMSKREGFFKFTGADGSERSIYGTLTQKGEGFTAEGVDINSGSKVSMSGSAGNVDAMKGEVSGYRVFSEQGSTGISERMNVSKGEALSQLSEMKGSNFYKGVEKMENGPVSLAIEKDTAGNISNVTATQGGRSSRLDQRDTNAMTTFKQGYDSWTGSKAVREDTDLNLSQKGTKSWAGYQGVTENSNTRTGVFKDTDPETGKQEMFYGRWHSDPATGKQVAADYTNLNTGRVSTVRTTTGEDGAESKHYGVGQYESGQGGVGQVSNFKELSHDEIQKGGFAANRISGQSGQVIYEADKMGQSTSVEHKFKYDTSKEFVTSAGDLAVNKNRDLTNLDNDQIAWIIGVGAANKGMEDMNKIVGAGRNLKTLHNTTLPGNRPAPPPGTKTVSPKDPTKTKPPRAKGR
ncbi:MAG: conjugal transfer protein TraG N-terminal domain-containing protein [Proteobacteria bacterium]|nr:conjugal transfer protein TraG N-terminal domain-containing protein [Pseudomonadota bacterium]